MSVPAYPSYRDSGTKWLGKLPSHWDVVRFKTVLRERDDRSELGDEELLSVSAYTGVSPRSQIVENSDYLSRAESLVGYKRCFPGDLVMNIMLAWNRGLGVTQYAGIVSPAYCVFALSAEVAPRFVDYLSRSNEYIGYFKAFSSGVIDSRLRLYPDTFGALHCGLPPLDEQVAIAAFLDRETAKIDALIEEQTRLIALLKEKRQAVISFAVTKGLDPRAPMKSSGIEWLGEVPAHWQILPLRRVVRQFVDYRGATPNKVSEGVPLITATQIKHGRIDHSLDPVFISEEEYADRMTRGFPAVGDLLLTTEAPLGEVALVDDERVAPGQRIILMKMADHLMTSGYLHAHFRSDFGQSELWTRASGSTASGIRADRLRGSTVLVPPLDEQQRIVSHIKRQTSAFDNVFAVVARGIQLLNERRAALISAAVIGKIDVRGSAKVLPFPIERTRARALVGTEIIERSAGQPTFGRVKFQKVAFLAEGHVGISELAGRYTRAAAGPLDGALIEDMEGGAHSIAGIEREQPGGSGTTNSYRLTQPRGARRQELADWLGPDRMAKLDKLIADFAPLNTKQAEAVATLYGVWNDLLSEGGTPSDDEIVTGFLNDWHPEKRAKFHASDLPEWLDWMRRHDIVPTGSGPKTTTGRLFV